MAADPGLGGSNSYGLVVFDCDGVLVDSEMITNRVYAAMLNGGGRRSRDDGLRVLRTHAGAPADRSRGASYVFRYAPASRPFV
jgi:hypothetical protein